MEIKLTGFDFGDYRDWFFLEQEKSNNLKFGTLTLELNGKYYKIKKVPCNVSTLYLTVSDSVEIVRKSNFHFEKYEFLFSLIQFSPGFPEKGESCDIIISTKRHLADIQTRQWRIQRYYR